LLFSTENNSHKIIAIDVQIIKTDKDFNLSSPSLQNRLLGYYTYDDTIVLLNRLYLILGIVVLNNANKVSDLEAKLVHILLNVAVGGLNPIKDAGRQVGGIGICSKK